MIKQPWFAVRKALAPRRRLALSVSSFLLPVVLWCLVSYVPFIWHPMVKVSDPGDVSFFKKDQLVKKGFFAEQNAAMRAEGGAEAAGSPANPVYLPAPHDVATAFYRAFTTPPRRPDQPWLHESLWHSIKVIFYGFMFSSLIGVPLGILCGTYRFFKRLIEPFVEFFRYLPAPAFGALAVAVLGINDAPKVAIIFIGTIFQQILVVSNTTDDLDVDLLEAAQTLGAKKLGLLFTVVIPGILPDLHRDQRILLGWAWTYLVIAEVVGTSTGITWFINQQAKYRIYDNVFAAILMIGILGLATDLILAWTAKKLYVWDPESQ
jgi:NitT/TauT family transport system permease protein